MQGDWLGLYTGEGGGSHVGGRVAERLGGGRIGLHRGQGMFQFPREYHRQEGVSFPSEHLDRKDEFFHTARLCRLRCVCQSQKHAKKLRVKLNEVLCELEDRESPSRESPKCCGSVR